eukprot:m.286145 g.286145  ORF g.286145 m.286145 type:complete len:192 (-) comp19437_c0_seq3:45-620(-)
MDLLAFCVCFWIVFFCAAERLFFFFWCDVGVQRSLSDGRLCDCVCAVLLTVLSDGAKEPRSDHERFLSSPLHTHGCSHWRAHTPTHTHRADATFCKHNVKRQDPHLITYTSHHRTLTKSSASMSVKRNPEYDFSTKTWNPAPVHDSESSLGSITGTVHEKALNQNKIDGSTFGECTLPAGPTVAWKNFSPS